ncbi:MAG: MFS transporter [Myxococcota bacterium]
MSELPAPRSLRDRRTLGVLIGCFVCQMGLGCGYVFSVTLKHVVADFEWSRAAYAAGGIPLLLAMGVSAPLLGALSERIGTRTVVSVSVLLLATSLGLLSRMETLLEFYLASALLGLGMTGVGDVVVGSLAARWVVRGRALALGFVFVGSNVGGAAVPPLAEAVAAQDSWRAAFEGVGLAALVILLPFALFALREPPAPVALPDGGAEPDALGEDSLDLGEALRTRSFWILALALLAFYFYYLGVNQHLVAFVSDLGYSDARAAASLGFAIFLGIFAKLAMGALADRIASRTALLANFGILTLGACVLLGVGRPPLLLLFLMLHGLAVAAENVVLPVVVADCFGVRHLAKIYGALMITLFPGGALGPVFAGAVYDRLGSYQLAFAIFAGLLALATGGLAFVRREARVRPRALDPVAVPE